MGSDDYIDMVECVFILNIETCITSDLDERRVDDIED